MYVTQKIQSYPFINVSCAGMSLKLIFENWIAELSEAWFLPLLAGWPGSLSTGQNYPLHCHEPVRLSVSTAMLALPPVPTSSRANMASQCSSCYLDAILSPRYILRQGSQLTKRSQAGFALRPARTGFQGSCLYVENLKIWKSCAYLVPICGSLKTTR